MSFAEILQQIPNLTFQERQELIRCAMEVDELGITQGEQELLKDRLADFQRDPKAGCALGELKQRVLNRLRQA